MDTDFPFRKHATGALGYWDDEFEERMNRTEKMVHSVYEWSEGQKIQFHTLWRLRCLLRDAQDESKMRQCASEVAPELPSTFRELYDENTDPTVERILRITRDSLPIPSDVIPIMKMGNSYRSIPENQAPHFDRTPESTLFLGIIYKQIAPLLNGQQQKDLQHLIKCMNALHRIVANKGWDRLSAATYASDAIKIFVRDLPESLKAQFSIVIRWAADYLNFLVSYEENKSFSGTNCYHEDTLGFVTIPYFVKGDIEPSQKKERRFRVWKTGLESAIESFTLKFDEAIRSESTES